jgi:hypothetical protein
MRTDRRIASLDQQRNLRQQIERADMGWPGSNEPLQSEAGNIRDRRQLLQRTPDHAWGPSRLLSYAAPLLSERVKAFAASRD